MFKRLKNVFAHENSSRLPAGTDGSSPGTESCELTASDWIDAHASFFKAAKGGSNFSITGMMDGKPWKLERAEKPRNYIAGEELRGRVETDANSSVTVLVMNRALKELLENRAYALYTDTLETEASPALMEEMRWLALYPEVGWDGPPDVFWGRYAVMTDRRSDAVKWLTPELVALLMGWPEPAPSSDVPFMLMLMRGRTHLRMQWGRADEHLMPHVIRLLRDASSDAAVIFQRQPDVFKAK